MLLLSAFDNYEKMWLCLVWLSCALDVGRCNIPVWREESIQKYSTRKSWIMVKFGASESQLTDNSVHVTASRKRWVVSKNFIVLRAWRCLQTRYRVSTLDMLLSRLVSCVLTGISSQSRLPLSRLALMQYRYVRHILITVLYHVRWILSSFNVTFDITD